MQCHDALELVGQVRAPGRLAARVSRLSDIERVRQVIDPRHQIGAENLAIGGDAAHRDAAEADAVVAAFPPDEAMALRFAAGTVIGERDLDGGIDRFGA